MKKESFSTQFLRAIVPNSALLCIAHERSVPAKGRTTKVWTQQFFTDEQIANGSLLEHVTELNTHMDTNIYFGVAAYRARERSKQNAQLIKCLLLDIDLKGDRPHYNSKADAVMGLHNLYKEIPCLPKPTIVDSGNGIHAYFTFTQPVSIDDWFVVANTFAKVVEHVDPRLLADPVPTKDAARVMRVPCTWNAKTATREYVKIMGHGTDVDFDTLKTGLAQAAAARNVWVSSVVPDSTPLINSPPPAHAIGTASSLSVGFHETTARFAGLNPVPIVKGCKQMHRMMTLHGNVSEPEWVLMLRVLDTCDKNDELVHAFSNGHPSYSRVATINKVRHLRSTFNSPSAGCDEFRAINPKNCEGCRFRDKVWTPSQIAEKVQQQETRELQKVEAVEKLQQGQTTPQGYLPLPVFYRQTRNADTHQPFTLIPVWVGEEEGEVMRPLIRGHINVIGASVALETDAEGEDKRVDLMIHLNVRVWQSSTDVAIAANRLTATTLDRATEPLRQIGMLFDISTPKEMTAVRKFLADIVNVASHRPTPHYATKGWTPTGLTVGATRFNNNGSIVNGNTYAEHSGGSPKTIEKFCSGRPVGTLAKWKHAISVFDGDHPYAQMVLLSGMSNMLLPLMPGMRGGILLALTGPIGRGKTSLMEFMNSFIGDPQEGIVQGSSTDKVMLDMLKQAGVFMLPVDDVTSLSAENLSAILSTVTSGKPRLRLEQDSTGSWSPSDSANINASLMLTSNFSTSAAFMAGRKGGNRLQLEAAQTRQLEIPAQYAMIEGVDTQRWRNAATLVRGNNGHALHMFSKYVVANRELVTEMLAAREGQFETALKRRLQGEIVGPYRFWCRYLAAVAVTAAICNDLKLVDWNLKEIIRAGLKLACEQQSLTDTVQADDMDSLWDLLTNDDNGRININLSEFSVTLGPKFTWPTWDHVHADAVRGQHRQWLEKGGSTNLFNQITNRMVNTAQWRIVATEVYDENNVLLRVERAVQIPLSRLRELIQGSDKLSATVWEELYGSLVHSGAKVIGIDPARPSRMEDGSRYRITTTRLKAGNAVRAVEILFPPILP